MTRVYKKYECVLCGKMIAYPQMHNHQKKCNKPHEITNDNVEDKNNKTD